MITGIEALKQVAEKFPSARGKDLSGIVGIISCDGKLTAILNPAGAHARPTESALVCSQGQTRQVALSTNFCETVPLQ